MRLCVVRPTIVCTTVLTAACSLFVGLDGLTGGANANGADGGTQGSDGASGGDGGVTGDGAAGDGAATSHYAATVLSDSPIAYWRLGDAVAPVAKNEVSGGSSGTYTGGVALGVPGAIANDSDTAAEFDGNDFVQIASSSALEFSGASTFSIEAWVKRTGTGDGILGKEFYDAGFGYAGWMLVFNGTGGSRLNFWRGAQEVDVPNPGDGAFFHVVVTFDSVTLLLFVNGVQVAANATSLDLTASGAPLLIGTVPEWGAGTAVIDEVALYDKALPPARVLAHYQAGTGK